VVVSFPFAIASAWAGAAEAMAKGKETQSNAEQFINQLNNK